MLTFNNNHIFTGYLKQLLASYPLTKYRVCNQAHPETWIASLPASIGGKFPQTDVYYLKDALIQKWQYYANTDTYVWQPIKANFTDIKNAETSDHYQWLQGVKDLNHTKTLRVNNNLYDSYTHEYLGDFLRFIRDYHGLNLMPLYNCFSNKLATSLDVVVYDYTNTPIAHFDAQDARYKIYAVPVKLFKEYTIAIECDGMIECCVGVYNQHTKAVTSNYNQEASVLAWEYGEKVLTKLHTLTYKHFANMRFTQPILLTTLLRDCLNELASLQVFGANRQLGLLANMQQDLCLFLKVPATLQSSIVVLQGNYVSNNDRSITNGSVIDNNRSIINFQHVATTTMDTQSLKTPLQLLRINTGTSYPFSDRLVEYMLGQTITPLQTIGDNVRRIRHVLDTGIRKNKQYSGIWSPVLQSILYNWATKTPNAGLFQSFGFVDKDLQSLFQVQQRTLLTANLYADDYPITGR